jgi:hypothetical protein
MAVCLVRRARCGYGERQLERVEVGSVDTTDADWGSTLDGLVATATDRVGLLNALVPPLGAS